MTDIQYFTDLYADFEQLIDDANQTAPEPGSRRHLVRPFGRLALGIAFATTAVASIVAFGASGVWGSSHAGSSATPTPRSRPFTVTPSGEKLPFRPTMERPIPFGSEMSLAAAATILGTPVLIPTTTLANTANLGPVWAVKTQSDSGIRDSVVALTFPSSGVIVLEQAPVPYSDPLSKYQAFLAQTPGAGKLITVNGNPGLELFNVDSKWASVETVTGGLRVVVEGRQSPTNLASIAAAIA